MSAPTSIREIRLGVVHHGCMTPDSEGEWPRLTALLFVARDLAEKVAHDVKACSHLDRGEA
ncbi:hypothetical protein [Prosthecomicrobium pneumaticum]|uniref:Uncharacterized protein n=1 Tax=Prosthecomicrobium pneumaticum TaxID=81895 RepID=A0A7W9FPD9_9HYPH|nr:hypothetical protein [Prosthecomicrobium pneumaticum]MBB5754350.1 hypothetical protein [Prosthecomicrobium pneumaticum]